MATLDVYGVSLHQRFLGQNFFNEFFYQQISAVDDDDEAQLLAQAFEEQFSTSAGGTAFDSPAFSDNLEIMKITVSNLFNPLQLGIILHGGLPQGTNTGTNDAPFVAYRLTSPRKRADMRNGNKYFGGICNGSAVDGLLNSSVVTYLETTAAVMSATLTWAATGGTLEWAPVIVKRVREGAGTPTDPYTYRLPDDIDEYEGYLADNWEVVDTLTTSNKRKIGRGI